jgi:hypothetical protein
MVNKRSFWHVLTLCIIFYLGFIDYHTPVMTQTHLGSIRGSILDPTGASIANATYHLVSQETGISRSGASTRDGIYEITQLQPGSYHLEVKIAGYKLSVIRVTLAVNQRLRLDVQLELGTLSEQVIVTAPPLALDQISTGLGIVLENRRIQMLPLDGRNFLELTLLAPGTGPAAPGSAGSVRGDFTFTAGGGRDDANSFLLDGAYNVDSKLNTPAVRPPVDAIAEFKVLTTGYDASFGRNAGAQVNVITKSGTNNLSGTAYGFFRTKEMNARNFFAPKNEPAPDYNRTQAGFSLGGAITQNRTFFFVDYEATRLTEGVTQVTNVPTAAEREGDFSNSQLRPPINLFTGQPFPGNRIPQYFLHPVGVALARLYPLPNRDVPFQNFVASPTLEDAIDHFDVKIDHNITASSKLSVRYSFNDRRLFEPYSAAGFAEVPGFGSTVPRRGQNLLISQTQVISPNLVNDVRVVFNRVASGVEQENIGQSLNQNVGLENLSENPRTWGLSFTTVTGFSPLGDEYNNPQNTDLTTIQILDTVTWSGGAHMVSAGADLRLTKQDGFRDVQSRGFLSFSDYGFTGNALADMLLGLPITTGGARIDNPQQLRTQSYNFFINDTIEITPQFTLSAGLRYEINTPPVDADDRANIYDLETGQLLQVGTANVPRGGYLTDKNNIAPRLGTAWSANQGRTVIRTGYGIYYNQSALAPGEGLYFNQPFFDFRLFFPLPTRLLTLTDPFPDDFPFPLPPSALTFQRDLRTPYTHQWNFGVQQEVGPGRTFEVAYVGSRGRNLIRGRDINQAQPSQNPYNLRPNPLFADIVSVESKARSTYDALQVLFNERMANGSVLVAYTLSDSQDDASGFFSSTGDPNFPQDSNNPDAEFGRSAFDVRHRFTMSFSYDLPFGPSRSFATRGWTAALFGGWQANGIVTVQSGSPFTVSLLSELDNSNTGRAALGFGFNDRPNVIADPNVQNPSADAWFNTKAFELPPFGSFGSAGRNILEGPSFANINLALVKHASISDGGRLQFRVEAFNLLNRVNLGLPNAFLGSPIFGQIGSAGSARRLQIGVRLLF